MDKQQAMSTLNCSVDSNSLQIDGNTTSNVYQSCWDYWQNCYYPYVIQPSYPVYIQERSLDRGKKAFEIIKILKDKKLIKVEKVSDFIDLMDSLIQIL